MNSDRSVLVTGGGGFLGKAIVRMLCERGEQVRSLSRGQYPELAAMGVKHISADLGDAAAVAKACRNVEAVFHTAAKPGVWGKFDAYYQANVQGTENVIAACRRQGVARLIYTSSPSVIFNGGDMENVDESAPYPAHYEAHYPRTKAMAERAVLQAARTGLPAVILRPHLIWGPEDPHLIPRLLARASRLRRIGKRDNRVDTVYVDNAAHAHLLAEEKLKEDPCLSGRIYFISQDDPISMWEMIDRILAAGGRPPVRGAISPAVAHAIGATLETLYKLLGIKTEPPITRFVANELATAHWFNIEAAKRDLGYQPLVSIDEGLKRVSEWLLAYSGSKS
ncbi:MAG: NAD-dependent epimerase/dehydratase family protein [Desulfatitalea sp.]|nr:NAD-dependent epimerase/dehydratase family protein [Desulfatitalea sp.]NNK01915.1 NAD-dependent epimerase/dehydratase family protein [Desulfatitalea sp.]